MHAIDAILVLSLLVSAARGFQIGFLRQATSTAGFLLGSLAGSHVGPFIAVRISASEQTTTFVVLLTILVLGAIGMLVGESIANTIRRYAHTANTQRLDSTAGIVLAGATFLLGVWIGSVLLALAPESSLQRALRSSSIVASLDRTMPSATQFLSSLNTLIGGTGAPEVFVGTEPSPDATHPLPTLSDLTTASLRARNTVYKIEGIGCGGIVDGSGFFISSHHIVTNAHVVAGLSNPKVALDTTTVPSHLVWFDAANDLAVLYVKETHPSYLRFADDDAAQGAAALIIGYPHGGERKSQPSIVTDTIKALGKDIYGRNDSIRNVLSLQSTIVQGNSGGPVLDSQGRVIGIVFATSTIYNNIGYAIAASDVKDALLATRAQTKPIGTQPCAQK